MCVSLSSDQFLLAGVLAIGWNGSAITLGCWTPGCCIAGRPRHGLRQPRPMLDLPPGQLRTLPYCVAVVSGITRLTVTGVLIVVAGSAAVIVAALGDRCIAALVVIFAGGSGWYVVGSTDCMPTTCRCCAIIISWNCIIIVRSSVTWQAMAASSYQTRTALARTFALLMAAAAVSSSRDLGCWSVTSRRISGSRPLMMVMCNSESLLSSTGRTMCAISSVSRLVGSVCTG